MINSINYVMLLILIPAHVFMGTIVSWEGTYSGVIEGTSATLTVKKMDTGLYGEVNASGYIYRLQGSTDGNLWSGMVTDIQSGVQLPFEAERIDDQIDIKVTGSDPATGQKQVINYRFTRGTAPSAAVESNVPGGPIDQQLVGRWTYSESYGSGQFTGVAQWQMQLNADGTFWYGKGQFAGGGPGISGSSSSGNVSTGQWKVEGKYIYVNEGDGWYKYAKYYVEGNDLMFTFDEDTREVWSR